MTKHLLLSAKGAPGVTCVAVALAQHWLRPVLLVEADPAAGSSIASGLFRGEQATGSGLWDLPVDSSGQELVRRSIPVPGTRARVLLGWHHPPPEEELVRAQRTLTTAITELDSTGVDVLVDLGRYRAGAPGQLLRAADGVHLVMGSSLPQVVAANVVLESLRPTAAAIDLIIAGPGRPYSGREIGAACAAPILMTLDHDPQQAQHYSGGVERGGGSPHAWAEALAQAAEAMAGADA